MLLLDWPISLQDIVLGLALLVEGWQRSPINSYIFVLLSQNIKLNCAIFPTFSGQTTVLKHPIVIKQLFRPI